jgi:hypothetical protein
VIQCCLLAMPHNLGSASTTLAAGAFEPYLLYPGNIPLVNMCLQGASQADGCICSCCPRRSQGAAELQCTLSTCKRCRQTPTVASNLAPVAPPPAPSLTLFKKLKLLSRHERRVRHAWGTGRRAKAVLMLTEGVMLLYECRDLVAAVHRQAQLQ